MQLYPEVFEEVSVNYWRAPVLNTHGAVWEELNECVLLEDGSPLPILAFAPPVIPPDAPSEILSGDIFFSTSDYSDPSTNGRSYELACLQEIFVYRARVVLKEEHSIIVINTTDYSPSIPLSMSWHNLDDSVFLNPYIRLFGWPDLRSISGIIDSVISPGMNEEEKVLSIWKFLSDWSYHYYSFNKNFPEEQFDPVKVLNIYGYSLCGGFSQLFSILCEYAGVIARPLQLEKHSVAEAYFNDDWHMFDLDFELFFRKENGEIASMDFIIDNPEIIDGPLNFPYYFLNIDLVDLYTSNNSYLVRPVFQLDDPHTMNPLLAPGTFVSFNHFDNTRLFTDGTSSIHPPPPWYSNGKVIKTINNNNIIFSDNIILIKEDWPYLILGAELKLTVTDNIQDILFYISDNGEDWTNINYQRNGNDIFINADDWFNSNYLPIYEYFIMIEVLDNIDPNNEIFYGKLETSFQFAPKASPHIQQGTNLFEVFLNFPYHNNALDWNGMEFVIEWFFPIRLVSSN